MKKKFVLLCLGMASFMASSCSNSSDSNTQTETPSIPDGTSIAASVNNKTYNWLHKDYYNNGETKWGFAVSGFDGTEVVVIQLNSAPKAKGTYQLTSDITKDMPHIMLMVMDDVSFSETGTITVLEYGKYVKGTFQFTSSTGHKVTGGKFSFPVTQ